MTLQSQRTNVAACKLVILSRFVALSVSLTRKVSLLQICQLIAPRKRRHDIAAIWVAFFSRCQRCRCGQALQTFEESTAGMVESFVARFPPEDPELYALYEAEKAQVTD